MATAAKIKETKVSFSNLRYFCYLTLLDFVVTNLFRLGAFLQALENLNNGPIGPY